MSLRAHFVNQGSFRILLLLLLLSCGENRNNMQAGSTINKQPLPLGDKQSDVTLGSSDVDVDVDADADTKPEIETELDPVTESKPEPPLNKGEVKTEINLGIGYEDYTDNDYNDSVVCFVGSFAVDLESRSIRSLEDQTIEIYVKRNSGSTQNISIGILRGDQFAAEGITETTLGRSEEKKFQLSFKANDKLQVDFSAGSNQSNKADLTSTERVVIEIDKCRTTGN